MPTLVRGSCALHYAVAGEGEPAVVLAHGMTGSGDADWRLLLPELTDRRTVVPDLRGHGASDFPADDFGYVQMQEDLRALVAAETSRPPHLVGFSMGAELLLELELAYPGTARSLVLIGGSTGFPAGAAGFPTTGVVEPEDWPAGLRTPHEAHHGRDHWRTLFRLVAGTWSSRPEHDAVSLARLRCPVLVVMGDDELAFKRRQAADLVAAVPSARLVEVGPAGHPVHVQQPERVNALVRAFLDEVDGTG